MYALESFVQIGDLQTKLREESDEEFLNDVKDTIKNGIAIMKSGCVLQSLADTTVYNILDESVTNINVMIWMAFWEDFFQKLNDGQAEKSFIKGCQIRYLIFSSKFNQKTPENRSLYLFRKKYLDDFKINHVFCLANNQLLL